jgi:hypothetical protein
MKVGQSDIKYLKALIFCFLGICATLLGDVAKTIPKSTDNGAIFIFVCG